MAAANAVLQGGDAVEDLSDLLFENALTDVKYQSCKYYRFSPVSAVKGSDLYEFHLDGAMANQAYLFNEHLLQVKVKLVKKGSDDPPAEDLKVAPINNIFHSLFKEVGFFKSM